MKALNASPKDTTSHRTATEHFCKFRNPLHTHGPHLIKIDKQAESVFTCMINSFAALGSVDQKFGQLWLCFYACGLSVVARFKPQGAHARVSAKRAKWPQPWGPAWFAAHDSMTHAMLQCRKLGDEPECCFCEVAFHTPGSRKTSSWSRIPCVLSILRSNI